MNQIKKVAKVKSPVQARSKLAFERIFFATTELMRDRTFDQLSVAEIAQAADVSVGSIYQRFKTKDDLLWAMYEEYLVEAEQAFADLVADEKSLRDHIGRLSKTISKLFSERRGIVRSLLWQFRHNPAEIPKPFLTRMEAIYAAAAAYLAKAARCKPSDSRLAYVVGFIVTTCREEFVFGDTRRLISKNWNADEFLKLQTDAAMGMLGK